MVKEKTGMKINEVEALVGITRKNIRFYEEQGLLHPGRNAANGYRDYSAEDVALLRKIKLLRRLSVPIEEIRRLLNGEQTVTACLDHHENALRREARSIAVTLELCDSIRGNSSQLTGAEVEAYLQQMDTLELGGNRFMNVRKNDTAKKKTGAAVAAAVMVLLFSFYIGIMIYAFCVDGMPLGVLFACLIIPAALIIGVILALRQRFKEIEGGEEDEASKY